MTRYSTLTQLDTAWIVNWAKRVNEDRALKVIGRFFTANFVIGVEDQDYFIQVRNGKIEMIADEPNANLDSDGESALTRAIQALRQDQCIVIVVSNRPSALAALDMAMVLYDGRVVAFGPRDEVFARVARQAQTRALPPQAPAAGPGPRAA